jgi:molybdate transport system permease protein
MEPQAIWLTLRLAATTTAILLAFAIPLSWWIANRRSASRTIVQALVALPLVLPPTVIGFYLLVGLGPLTWPGRAIIHVLGHPLAFSFSGLVVGSILYDLPFAILPLVAGFQAIGPEYVEAASLLGASPLRSFFDVTLPLARPALIGAAVLVFLHTIGEFGVVLMVGGNIPGTTQTLSILLFDLVEDGRYADANRTALSLIALAVIGLVIVYARRPWRSNGTQRA